MKFFAKSVPSVAHPQINEDLFLADPKLQIAAVFDGVGGLSHGEKASSIAAKSITQSLKEIPQNTKPKDIKNLLEKALIEASNKIVQQYSECATVATVAKFVKNDRQTITLIGHVGDSRAYLFHQGKLVQITQDDNLVLESGLLKEVIERINQRLEQLDSEEAFKLLTPQEKKYFLSRNIITQVLGDKRPPSPHIYKVILEKDDKLILTSDGVHDNLTRSEIENIVNTYSKNLAEALVDKAYNRSKQDNIRAKPDDISAVVVDSF